MKIPFNEAETLQYLEQEEKLNNSWSENLVGMKPKIISTKELAKLFHGKIEPLPESKTFSRSKIEMAFIALFAILFIAIIIYILNKHTDAGSGASLFLPLFLVIFITSILSQLFSNKENLSITLRKEYMVVQDIVYYWDSIYEAYIVIRPHSRSSLYHLVLALDTGVTDRYEITNLVGLFNSQNKIAAYIESYKHS